MSDTEKLRARIGRTIWEASDEMTLADLDVISDAVISELGLLECSNSLCRCDHAYVTRSDGQ